MPPKHSIKEFIPGDFYHIYNRGVAKQKIFNTKADYVVFCRFLKEYLLPPNHPDLEQLRGINPRRVAINCHSDVELHGYCLMPNHFHPLLRLRTDGGISRFMKALATNYSMHYNKTYDRVGPLFQGVYKAVWVGSEEQLLHLSRYIHRNPQELLTRDQPLQAYSFSSYPNYLTIRFQDWLCVDTILPYFSESNPRLTYRAFVEELDSDPSMVEDVSLD